MPWPIPAHDLHTGEIDEISIGVCLSVNNYERGVWFLGNEGSTGIHSKKCLGTSVFDFKRLESEICYNFSEDLTERQK